MKQEKQDQELELLSMTSEIVSAFVGNNRVEISDLPGVIRAVQGALAGGGVSLKSGGPAPKPVVPVRSSITRTHIICLEDGLQFKSLKRHLRTKYGMTPEEYRQKWGLPPDYPMVAPSYAAARSKLAKQMGLGRKSAAPKRRGRPPKIKTAAKAKAAAKAKIPARRGRPPRLK